MPQPSMHTRAAQVPRMPKNKMGIHLGTRRRRRYNGRSLAGGGRVPVGTGRTCPKPGGWVEGSPPETNWVGMSGAGKVGVVTVSHICRLVNKLLKMHTLSLRRKTHTHNWVEGSWSHDGTIGKNQPVPGKVVHRYSSGALPQPTA